MQKRKLNLTVSPSASGPGDDLFRCPLDPHHRTVDAKIVVLRRTPVPAGIGVVVFLPLLINFSDSVLRLFLPDALDLHPASDPVLKGGADEQADRRDAGGAENDIGAPPHDDAGTHLGQFQNHLALHLKQDVLRRLSLPHLRAALIDAGKQPRVRGFFFLAREQFLPYFRLQYKQ